MGTAALAAFVALALSLHRLETLDALVANAFDRFRGCHTNPLVKQLSGLTGQLAAGVVVSAAAMAVAGGARLGDVRRTGLWLGIALTLVEVLKLSLERGRPEIPPWHTGGSSFPSGHVASIALCLGAALRVGQCGRHRWPPLRLVPLVVGALLVPAVVLCRLYLGRHWATDVAASVLLATAFWGLVDDARRPIAGWRGGLVLAGLLAAPLLALPTGRRLVLPSPSTLASRPTVAISGRSAQGWAVAPGEEVWVLEAQPHAAIGHIELVRRGSTEISLPLETGRTRDVLLKVVGRPLAGLEPGCHALDLLVDGMPLGGPLLRPSWQTYAFALPALGSGHHELRLRVAPLRSPRVAREATLAVYRLALEGGTGDVRLAASVPSEGARIVRSGEAMPGRAARITSTGPRVRARPAPAAWTRRVTATPSSRPREASTELATR